MSQLIFQQANVQPVLQCVFDLLDGREAGHIISAKGFHTGSAGGYHFSNETNGRCCNVVNNNVTEGLIFNCGTRGDYHYPSGLAKDEVVDTRRDFPLEDHYCVSYLVLNWLTGKPEEYRGPY